MGMSVVGGWTIITPTAPAGSGESYSSGNGTRKIYVSQAGNDSTGTGTAANPFRTPDRGVTALRDGFPDWLLLRKGDTWTDEVIGQVQKSGLSATEPLVFSSYDPADPTLEPNPASGGARPVMRVSNASTPGTTAIGILFGDKSFWAVLGLEFTAYTRDPANGAPEASTWAPTGAAFAINSLNYLLMEDNKFSYFGSGIDVAVARPDLSSNISLRRNIIMDSYTVVGGTGASTSNGIFAAALVPGNLFYENLIDRNGWNPDVTDADPTGFHHNFYFNDMQNDGDVTTFGNPAIFTNNIVARDGASPQGRSGGQFVNNLWVNNCQALVIQQLRSGYVTNLTDNVITEGVTNSGVGGANGWLIGNGQVNTGVPSYNGSAINAGTAIVSDNIIANALTTNAGGISLFNGQNGNTISDNIVYNWGTATPSDDLTNTVGGIYSLTITTPGSGYTDKSMSILSAAASTGDFAGLNYIELTVTSNAGVNGRGRVWVTGTSGVPASGPWFGRTVGSTKIVLTNSVFTSSFTGTLYYPYNAVNLSGGAGTNGQADIIVAGGAVVALVLTGAEAFPTGAMSTFDDPGFSYVAGNVLSATITGGSGFTCTVGAICVNTVTPNELDPTGLNTAGWPDPTRTVARYDDEVLGGPGTIDDFLDLARGQRRGSWNDAYTADAVNDWIREGFEITAVVGTSRGSLRFHR